MKVIELKIENDNGRIDSFLADKINDISRSYVKRLIKKGQVKVNNDVIKPKYKVSKGDKIIVNIPKPKKLEAKPENIEIEIIYEDEDVAVVNKPRGMVVHPAAGNYSGTLVNALLYNLNNLSSINGVIRPGIVHRIDKDTTGLLMIAKNNKSHRILSKQLKKHSITRQYYALVIGNIKEEKGIINAPIGRHPVHRKKMAVTKKNSKGAITHFEVIERFKQYTLIKAELETGRTHQIRVHMSYIKHPIVGDPVYGVKNKKYNLKGQLLHAKTLGFSHPTEGNYLEFNSKLPDDFTNILKILRKKSKNT